MTDLEKHNDRESIDENKKNLKPSYLERKLTLLLEHQWMLVNYSIINHIFMS